MYLCKARAKTASLFRIFLVSLFQCLKTTASSPPDRRAGSSLSTASLSFFQIQPLFVNVGNRTRFYFNMRLGVSESFANFDQARIMFKGPNQTSSIITWISKSRSLLRSQSQFASSSWFEETDEGGPWVVEKLVLYNTNANGVL